MPIYDFRCVCGNTEKDVEQSINDPHTLACYCGRTMTQDFGDYKPPMVFGELPTRGCWNGYYDPNLGANITSSRQRKDLMAAKGLVEFEMGADQAKMHEEVKYIQKNAGPKQARKAVNKLAADVKKKADERIVSQTIDPIIDRVVATL